MLSEKVVQEMKSAVKDLGYDLVHVELKGGRGKGVFRLFIEQEGGVTVDDCQKVSREVSVLLDVLDPVSHTYSLEVSSPGVQRPIYHDGEYQNFIERNLYVKMREPSGGTRVMRGVLAFCDDRSITLRLKSGEQVINKHHIHEARLLGPWEEVD